MPDINKAIVLSDGTVTNLIDPITKQSVNYKPTLVWYDETPMSNAKCDGNLYRRKGSVFYKKVIDKDGELFLEKDTMSQMRTLSSWEILLLKSGVVKGVRLNGYYTKDDTPAPIEYYNYSSLTEVDNGGSIIEIGSFKLYHKFLDRINASYFGFKTDYNTTTNTGTDNITVLGKVYAECILRKCKMVIPSGDAMVTKFGRFNGVDIEGYGANVYLKYDTTPTLVQIGSNSRVEGIKFYSLVDMSYNRAGIEQAENVYLFKCGFYNFLHSVPAPNAWGLYLKNATNVVLDSLDFGNNSQSDLAIVDNCKNVTIINPSNITQEGVYLNIEPNGNEANVGITVIGGVYRRVTILANTFTSDPIQSSIFNGVQIKSLRYKGANVSFSNTKIDFIEDALSEFLGDIDIKATIGNNLLKDPYMFDIANSDITKSWISATGTFRVDRTGKDYTTINFENVSQTSSVTTSDYIPAIRSDLFVISLNGRGNYLDNSSQISRNIDIMCYNDADVITGTITMSCLRFPSSTNGSTGFKNQSTFFRVPEGTTKFKPRVGNVGTSTKSLDVRFISINKVLSIGDGISISEYITSNLPKGVYKVSSPNISAGFGSAGAKYGDIVKTFTPSLNKVESWVVTAEGRPATFTPLTNLNVDLDLPKRGTNAQRPDPFIAPVNYPYYNTEFTRHEFNTGGLSPAFVPASPSATTSLKGTVNQASAIANIVTANAIDLPTALILLNEIKGLINTMLAADRVSGQRVT